MYLGRCKNKLNVGRRFLHYFQERIECLLGEHMNLVYDIDSVFAPLGSVDRAVPQIADVVNTIV